MEIPFIDEEGFTTLSILIGDEAPDPNAFTLAFWQHGWETVKIDIMRMFKDFFETRNL